MLVLKFSNPDSRPWDSSFSPGLRFWRDGDISPVAAAGPGGGLPARLAAHQAAHGPAVLSLLPKQTIYFRQLLELLILAEKTAILISSHLCRQKESQSVFEYKKNGTVLFLLNSSRDMEAGKHGGGQQ